MAELPTKEELERLYHEKGHDALVWYAWRNSLRVAPLLGRMPLCKVWPEDTVQHVYAVCRSYMALAQWPNNQKKIHEVAYEFASAAAGSSDKAVYSLESINTDVAGKEVIKAVLVAFSALETAETPLSQEVARTISAHPVVRELNTQAATFDFTLLKGERFLDHTSWFKHPLWQSNKSADSTETSEFNGYQKQFLSELNNLGLDFLAQDMEKLWKMEPLGDHAENYLESLSDTITSDPVVLREAILSGKDAVEQLQTVRILLLGPGGAGKSSLRDRLLGRELASNEHRDATIGVEYEWLDPFVLHEINPDLTIELELSLRLWDFGGQTIFHGLHSAFLHENCVYVLVVDSRHEQAPDNWLYQIRDLTEKNPHVLIVTNRYDHCDTKQNETRLIREFPELLKSSDQFFYFSCHQSDEPQFKAFVQTLINQSMNSRHQVLKLAMDVQRKMEVEFKGEVFLEALHIEELIPEHLVEKYHQTIVDHLDQLGYMIPVTHGGTNYCLKPEWAVKHAYDLIHSKALRDAEACASKITLQRMLKEKISLEEANFLIQFLESYQLCQKLDNNEYFFPDSAPANEQVAVREIQNEKEALALRFDLPFLPLGIHTRFIHQLFKAGSTVRIPNTQSIWRQGFLLECGGARASVQYQWRKSCIEIRMAGEVERFADILEAFDNALGAVLEKGVLRRKEVQPYILYDYDDKKRVYSLDSSELLIKELRRIKHIRQLFPEVQAMVAKKIDLTVGDNSNVSVAMDAHDVDVTQKSHSDNTTMAVDADQRQQIATIVSELLIDAATLPVKQLVAVSEVKKALEAPARDEKSQGLLGRVWQGINDSVGLAANGLTAADLAVKYKDPILAAFTLATASTGS